MQNIFGGRGGMNVKNTSRLKKMKAGGPQLSCRFDTCKENTGVEAWVAWYQHSSRAKRASGGVLQSAMVPAAGAAHVRVTISCTWKGLTDCHSI